jgi:hypothetical protein
MWFRPSTLVRLSIVNAGSIHSPNILKDTIPSEPFFANSLASSAMASSSFDSEGVAITVDVNFPGPFPGLLG